MTRTHNPRIYIVIGTFHPLIGGAETQALAQSKVLREKGYETTIITFRHKKQWPIYDEIDGIPIIRVAGSVLDEREKYAKVVRQLLYMLALLILGWSLWRLRHKYDILQVYQLSALTLPAALACRFAKKPILISVHSTGMGKAKEPRMRTSLPAGPLDPSLPCLQVSDLDWVNGDLDGLVRLGQPAVRFTYRLLHSIHARIIILSSRMKDYLAENDFILPNMQLIPNGVDITRYSPQEESTNTAQKAHTVVCVSRMHYVKGIDILLQAWYLVQQELPQARLILVGGGPMYAQFVELAKALGIEESVEFTGLQHDIPAYLHRAALSVLPSRFEGMPNAVLEAMACGLPCVATRVSGSEDIIQHAVNGLLTEVEDYHGIAQALLILLRNPAMTRAYGKAARLTIEQHYSFEHITNAYLALYRELLAHQQKETAASSIKEEMYRLPL